MLFNSLTYFFFITAVFLIYWLILTKSLRLQNYFLFLASYCFYGWWDVRFLILIFISSLVDFFAGQAIYRQTDIRKKKYWLWACMTVNLGMLGFFKYYNFFVDSFVATASAAGFDTGIHTLKIILPVGISFYTFQSLSYSIDIYRGKFKPTNDFVAFMTFVSFFPQLVAGPIERASELLPQFLKNRKFNPELIASGFRYILYGLFKKMVIADRLAWFVNHIYASSDKYDGTTLLIATFMFGFQIYCDFSGYSDIAIGSARLLGFDLMQNFKTPYLASGFQDFWRRWHISLSTWFRDYLYIPLGGNRVTESRWIFNILITFTLSGLWHGAAITFIVWGFLHGALLVLEHYFKKFVPFPEKASWTGLLVTFTAVNLIWVFFRSENITQALNIFSEFKNLNLSFISGIKSAFTDNFEFREAMISLMAGLPLFLASEVLIGKSTFNALLVNRNLLLRWSIYVLFGLSILLFGVLHTAPEFIYFQF